MHERTGRVPALVREGFSVGCLIFGPIWLVMHRAWVAALLVFALEVALGALLPGVLRGVALAGVAVALGVFGNDLRRWALLARGYALVHVVAARDRDAALARLLALRPDLAGVFAA